MTQEQYKILFRHVFNWPNRKMCIREWKRLYTGTPFYVEDINHINTFFNMVLKSEFNRLRDPKEQTYPEGEFTHIFAKGSDTDIDKNISKRMPTEQAWREL